MKTLSLAGILLHLILFPVASWAAESLTAPTGVSPYSSLNITSNFNATIASTRFNWNKDNARVQNLTLKVRSLYGGLRHTTVTTSKIAYTLTYAGTGGTTVTISTTDQQIGARSIAAGAAAGNETKNSSIAYTGVAANLLYQGTYTDTLTYTYTDQHVGGATNSYTRTLVLTAQAIGSSIAFSITPDANASSLPFSAGLHSAVAVGTAYETSNSTTGYFVKVRTTNAGKLTHATLPSNQISYTGTYNGGAMTLSSTDTTIKTVAQGIYNSSSSAIAITYTVGALVAGNYTDTLTFTILAQ